MAWSSESITDPRHTGADYQELCERRHLDYTFAPVARPTGNAIAARFIQTLAVELVWPRDWVSIEELRDAIRDWLHI